jgi:hypothetical protein
VTDMLAEAHGTLTKRAEKEQAGVAVTSEASDATRPQPGGARPKRKQSEVRSTRAPTRVSAHTLSHASTQATCPRYRH